MKKEFTDFLAATSQRKNTEYYPNSHEIETALKVLTGIEYHIVFDAGSIKVTKSAILEFVEGMDWVDYRIHFMYLHIRNVILIFVEEI